MEIPPRPKINYEVPIKTGVIDQQDEGACVDITVADVTTIIYRMNNDDPDDSEDATPQIGIDADGGIDVSIEMCINPDFGLEKTGVYPWCKIARDIKDWTQDKFETSCDERLRLQNMEHVVDIEDVEPKLLEMFGEGGDGYPVGGIMIMGEFADPDVARGYAQDGVLPYRYPPNTRTSGLGVVRHALLIVGMNTMSENRDEHYCVVKNSYGDRWGNKGYSKVGIEVFIELLYPIQPKE